MDQLQIYFDDSLLRKLYLLTERIDDNSLMYFYNDNNIAYRIIIW